MFLLTHDLYFCSASRSVSPPSSLYFAFCCFPFPLFLLLSPHRYTACNPCVFCLCFSFSCSSPLRSPPPVHSHFTPLPWLDERCVLPLFLKHLTKFSIVFTFVSKICFVHLTYSKKFAMRCYCGSFASHVQSYFNHLRWLFPG